MSQEPRVPFEPGQTVIVGTRRGADERWSRTMVLRVDPRLVWVDGAPAEQPPLDIQPGEDVVCHTWRSMDALYQAQARVAFTRLAPAPLIGLTVLSSERIQQREYVRVPLATEARGLFVGARDTVRSGSGVQPFRLQVRDLSAGGLRGHSNLPLAPGDELAIDLPLPRADQEGEPAVHLRGRVVALPDLPEPLNLRARVVRLVETGGPDDLACDIGVAFVDVTGDVRERIIRYALDVQRDRRRRGML